MEAMEKSGFGSFKPEIDKLLADIEKEVDSKAANKKRKNEPQEGPAEEVCAKKEIKLETNDV